MKKNNSLISDALKVDMPTLFVGAAGVGKTATVLKNYDHVEIILLSACSEEDIGGLPYRDGDYDYKTTPSFLKRLREADNEGKSTSLFLDEIDKADRSVADTLLTLVGSRKVGNEELPEKTKIVLAANSAEYGGGDGLSIPMMNRCVVVEFQPDPSIWGSFMLKKFKTEKSASVISLVLDGTIPILETTGDGIETRTTSPRSLEMALRVVETVKSVESIEALLSGLVTPNAVSKIMARITEIEDEKHNEVFSKACSLAATAQKSAPKQRTRRPMEL